MLIVFICSRLLLETNFKENSDSINLVRSQTGQPCCQNRTILIAKNCTLLFTDSLQIVGPNNIGKSTLIYALNFLYIIDGKQMTFSGNRTGDKTTFNQYLPSINSSYIIFEIFKKRYYCILVKKNAEESLDYYKIDSDFKEEQYFKQSPEGQTLKKFDSLLADFSSSGVAHHCGNTLLADVLLSELNCPFYVCLL